jgi:hypothetical protein
MNAWGLFRYFGSSDLQKHYVEIMKALLTCKIAHGKHVMAHVVMQAAEFPSIELAQRGEKELRALIEQYVQFERSDPDPWGGKRVPPPLVAFGDRHGIALAHR